MCRKALLPSQHFMTDSGEKIADIETVEQRNNILSDMQQYFEREVRQEPRNRNKLSEIYQLLKQKCWEVGLCGNG